MKVKRKATRRCPVCGVRFVPKKPWQEYDKTTCRQSAYVTRMRELAQKAREAGLQ